MLIVHIGAGSHSRSLDHKYRRLLRRALEHSLEDAVRRVEHSALTNTGYGAALDAHGAVSCDATVVEAAGGRVESALSLLAVGDAASPTEACLGAKRKMDREWAPGGARARMGFLRPAVMIAPALDKERAAALVLEGARLLYQRYEETLAALQDNTHENEVASDVGTEMAGKSDILGSTSDILGSASGILERTPGTPEKTPGAPDTKSPTPTAAANATIPESLQHHRERLGYGVLDTVGYIEVGARTRVAASLGGMWLRPRGRVSCAGIPGAGAAYAAAGAVDVSCVCTGNGDDIVRMGLAAHVCDELVRALAPGQAGEAEEDLVSLAPLLVSIVRARAASVALGASHKGEPVCYVGVLACVRVGQQPALLVFCHSTESFYFGFRARRPRVVLSRLRTVGSFVSGEYILHLDSTT